MDLGALERNYRPGRWRPESQPQAQQPQDNGLLSLIPFYDIGQKVLSGRGNEVNPLDVGLEAALTFLPFGKVAKGVTMLGKAGSKTTAQAAKGTIPALTNFGGKLRGNARDIRIGTKMPGTKRPLDEQDALRINEAVDKANTGKMPRNPRKQLQNVQAATATTGSRLGQITAAANRPLDPSDIDSVSRLVDESRRTIVAFNPRNSAHVALKKNFDERVASAKTLEELEQQRKYFDEEAKALLANPDSKGALSARLAKAYRTAIDKHISQVAPELKAAKGDYKTLKDAEALLSRSKVVNPEIRTPVFGGPLPFVGNAVRAGQEMAGSAMQAIGGASLPARIGRETAGLAGRQVVGDTIGALQPKPTSLEGALQTAGSGIDPMGGTTGGFGQTGAGVETADQNPYPRENLLADMQRDPANADEYIKMFQMYQELYNTSAPELTAGQQDKAVRAQNALGDIDVIAQAIESGDIDKGLVPFSNNALVGNALGMGSINAALFNLGDIVLRSRTGAAAPKEEVEKFIAGYLPRAGESKETKLYKLQRARAELLSMMNPPAALGTGTANTLEDVFSNVNGARM